MSITLQDIIDGITTAVGGLGSAIVNNPGQTALGGAGLLLGKQAYDKLGDIGEQIVTGVDVGGVYPEDHPLAGQKKRIPGTQELALEGLSQSAFKPFTISTALGGTAGASIDPETGDLVTTLGFDDTLYGGYQKDIAQDLLKQAHARFDDDPRGFYPEGHPLEGQPRADLMSKGATLLDEEVFGLKGQRTQAKKAFGLGKEFMGKVGQDLGEREQDVYERIRATQLEEEANQRLALEERLFSQGRSGVSTAMFGGTPEQLALAKAQESAKNQAALMALTQAQQEQKQQADIGATFGQLGSNIATQRQALEAGRQQQGIQALMGDLGIQGAQQQLGLQALAGAYVPQAQMQNAMQQALQIANLQQRGQLYGAGLFGETSMSGLEGLLGAGLGQANLMGTIATGLLSGALGN